jgi:hypothetical protein
MWYVYSKKKKLSNFIMILFKVLEILDNAYKNGNEKSLMEILLLPSHSDYFVAYLR